jgi:Fe2+ transport system protein FeoA
MIQIADTVDPLVVSSLAAAPCGKELRIAAFEQPGEATMRLQAMGLCDGRRVELVRSGDPLIVRVMGTRIGISRRLARQINVVHS